MGDDWELCYNLGVALGDLGQFLEEAEMYRRALKINPAHAKSWANLGIAVASSGNIAASVPAFQKAVQFEPENGQNWHNLAKSLKHLGRSEESESAMLRASALGVGAAPRRNVEVVEDF